MPEPLHSLVLWGVNAPATAKRLKSLYAELIAVPVFLGYRKPVEAAPFPNKMTREDMVHDILKHMSHYFDMRPAEVTRLVVGNVPNSATATYCLLAQRLIRHHAQAQHLARIQKAANDTNMERVLQNTSVKTHVYNERLESLSLIGDFTPCRHLCGHLQGEHIGLQWYNLFSQTRDDYSMDETRRKPTTRTQCPTVCDIIA